MLYNIMYDSEIDGWMDAGRVYILDRLYILVTGSTKEGKRESSSHNPLLSLFLYVLFSYSFFFGWLLARAEYVPHNVRT